MRKLMAAAASMAMGLGTVPAAADATGLWTVQAVDTGSEQACDAFARGMDGRPPYEFRFRRTRSTLLLVVSYEGPKIAAKQGEAEITFDGRQMLLPAVALKFGGQPAFAISLDPARFDFHQFDTDQPISIRFGGQRFELAFLASDRLGASMAQCLEFAGFG